MGGVAVTLWLLAAVLMVFVYMIPHESIARNCLRSSITLAAEGNKPSVAGCPLLRVDNFTDALMLNMAYSADDGDALVASMANIFYTDDDMHVYERTMELFGAAPVTEGGYGLSYARYWHGHQLILRPLLVLTDYAGILMLNALLLLAELAAVLWLAWRRLSHRLAMMLLAALLVVALPMVATCLQFAVCFHIALLAMMVLMLWPRVLEDGNIALATFTAIGGLTAIFDLLTTPMLTLCLPLAVCLLRQKRWQRTACVLRLASAWLVGYAVLWLAKCVTADVFTGEDVLGDFIANSTGRSLAGSGLLTEMLSERWGGTMALWLLAGMAVIIVVMATLCIILWQRIRRTASGRRHSWLLVIAALPLCWYVATLQHSVIHFWFVWRSLAATFFALLTFLTLTRNSFNDEEDSCNYPVLQ